MCSVPLFMELMIGDGMFSHIIYHCQQIDKLRAWPAHQDTSLSAPQHPLDGLVLNRFSRNAQDRSDTLWCVALSMEMIIGAGIFHLPFGCMAMDWQALNMTCMSGCRSFRPDNAHWMACFSEDLAETHRIEVIRCGVCLCPWSS